MREIQVEAEKDTVVEEHWLVVPTDPEDDLTVEHGESCSRGDVQVDACDVTGAPEYAEDWTCGVSWYVRENGLDEDFRHRDAEPDYWGRRAALPPGRHRLRLWEHQSTSPEAMGEWDWGLEAELDPAVAQAEQATLDVPVGQMPS